MCLVLLGVLAALLYAALPEISSFEATVLPPVLLLDYGCDRNGQCWTTPLGSSLTNTWCYAETKTASRCERHEDCSYFLPCKQPHYEFSRPIIALRRLLRRFWLMFQGVAF
eukprot:TRINITY_DN10068_c0_g1_i1.p1 TRINITY_DN10068_c0_g1~~TRINITY_DN10068_c0_g1_i1.p1  ORF type:complete len:111 (-),score=7.10 TRINITY_DN10068_c0_g1_i1:92-424(-)